MTEEHLKLKIAYLEQENNQLRSALLNYQIVTGEITFQGEPQQGENEN